VPIDILRIIFEIGHGLVTSVESRKLPFLLATYGIRDEKNENFLLLIFTF
jgi:hypothetical protein